jgi:TetR/AcrR family transcriptional regulator, cholesterol catabolism regulator
LNKASKVGKKNKRAAVAAPSTRKKVAAAPKAAEPVKVPGKRGPKVDVEQTLRRKREIVQGAARLFDHVGYHGVNMSMIAEAAGVKKPTLYHYIKSKDEILFMLHELFIGTLRKNTDARIEQGADELAILRGVVVDTFRLLHDYPGYMRAFFEHSRELGREQWGVIATKRDEYIAVIVGVIEKAMAKGLINKAPARLTANCLFAIGNWPYQWYRPAKDPAPEILAEQCWQIFLRGLAAR